MTVDNPWQTTSAPIENPWEERMLFVREVQEASSLPQGRLDALDFMQAIEQNRRNTWYLISGMIFLAALFGYVLGWGWDAVTGKLLGAATIYSASQQMPWRELILTPSQTGLMVGAAMLAAMAVWSLVVLTRGDTMVLNMAGAKEVPHERMPQLHHVVEEVAIAAGLPKPKVYLIPTRMPNAFATGLSPDRAAVGITTGLLDRLNRRELQGVMAHEMGHILNGDMRYATLMAVMTGVLVFVAEIILNARRFFYYGGSYDRQGNRGHPLLLVVMMVVFLITAILVPILARLIQMAISRQREYLADATAAKLTRDPGGLIAALQKIAQSDEQPAFVSRALEPLFIVTPQQMLQNGHRNWFSTHPSIESRVARLKALE